MDEFATFLEQLKTKLDIIDVVSKYVVLNKKGSKYWGCCPFHHEKTPSFSVDAIKQFYYCFGCKEAGDVVKFVQKVEGVDFMGAITILANQAGMEVPALGGGKRDSDFAEKKAKRKRVYELLRESAKYYNKMLKTPQAKTVNEYLARRGLSQSTITKFGLGFSPDWTSSIIYLTKLGYTEEELVESGIAGNKNGRLYDVYAERIMFPVIDTFGEVVAFSGRTLDKHAQAKYKNTADTIAFNKKKILYGLNLVKKLKVKQDVKNIILVEGQMDAISVYEAGFHNVVASMGTAFTKEQAKLLKYMVGEVLVSYDGDLAGIKGAIRAIELLEEEGVTAKVVCMPKDSDPDEIIKGQGADAYRKLLDEALPVADFKMKLVREKFDVTKVGERRQFIEGMLKVIAKVDNSSEKEIYLKNLRDETKVSIDSLTKDMDSIAIGEEPTRVGVEVSSEEATVPIKAIRFLLSQVIDGKKSIDDIECVERFITNEIHRIVYYHLKESQGQKINTSILFSMAQSEDESKELGQILDVKQIEHIGEDMEEKYFNDCMNKFKYQTLLQEKNRRTALFSSTTDINERQKLLPEIQRLSMELNKLKE
ncbi:MAG: DNA primase [Clostridia bacterium]